MKTRSMRLVVRPHYPLRQFLLLVAGVIFLGLGGWVTFEYGQWQQLYARMTALASSSRPDMEAESVEQLKADNERLRQRVAILERAAQIDHEASVRLQGHVRALQDDTFELREEVEFYRAVVSAAKKATGLRIQGLRVSPLGESGHYHYKLVLTNLNKDDKVSKGDVLIEILGRDNAAVRKLNLAALADNPDGGTLPFSFMHFHRLEGDFALPEGYFPESVRVVVREGAAKEPREEKTYDWKPLIQAEG
ncbi:MAG: DUF6776 family protein [Chromatiales bacterium]